MELLVAVGALVALTVGILTAGLWLNRAARLRRRARRTPLGAIGDARRDDIVRVRGIVRATGPSTALPFSGKSGVFHWTQITDTANPGQTSVFTRGASCGFLVDDGTGQARIPKEVPLEIVGREPEGGGVDRNDPEVPRFLGRDEARLFSKGGSLLWRQLAIAEGEEVVIWGRVQIEPDPDPRHQQALREGPERVVLVPADPDLPLVVEKR